MLVNAEDVRVVVRQMWSRRLVRLAALASMGASALAGAPGAGAAGLAPGDHALAGDLPLGAAPDIDERAPLGAAPASGLVLQFTPRNPLLLLFGEAPEPSPEPAELHLWLGESPQLGLLGMIDGSPTDPEVGSGGRLEIGGALRWSDWSVGSSYARTRLFGGDTNLLSASLGYGRMTARLGFGETERQQAPAVDVMMFSTDLATSSWLTLEGDLAVGSGGTGESESLAVGRLGFRLNF